MLVWKQVAGQFLFPAVNPTRKGEVATTAVNLGYQNTGGDAHVSFEYRRNLVTLVMTRFLLSDEFQFTVALPKDAIPKIEL